MALTGLARCEFEEVRRLLKAALAATEKQEIIHLVEHSTLPIERIWAELDVPLVTRGPRGRFILTRRVAQCGA